MAVAYQSRTGLDDDWMRTRFERDGYVVLRSYIDSESLADLRRAIDESAKASQESNPLSRPGMQFLSNAYRSSQVVRRFSAGPAMTEILLSLGLTDAWLRWDQAVWKSAGGPRFPWHQDNGYSGLDATHVQIWIALTPMTRATGCLEVAPGHHRRAARHHWVDGHAIMDTPTGVLSIEADAGDVVVFSSLLPHSTSPNPAGPARLASPTSPSTCRSRCWIGVWIHLMSSSPGTANRSRRPI